MTTMAQSFKSLDFSALCDALCENKKTLIIYHIRSDADAVGSAFALRELFRLQGIFAYCACADEIPDRLRFLADGVQGSVLIERDMPIGYERVISVDSASPAQLGELFTTLHRDVDIMIDHHASGTPYADNFIDANASATGEIIYKIASELLRRGVIESLNMRILSCIYAAISSDTGGFRYANATPESHRIASELVLAGVDTAEINRLLFDSKPLCQLRAEGEAARRLRIHFDGRVACTLFPFSLRAILGVSDEHLGTLIDVPRSVEGVEVAFAVKEESDGSFRVSLRSATELDVAAVAAAFGGGGHKRASGCTITAPSIEAAEQAILSELNKIM